MANLIVQIFAKEFSGNRDRHKRFSKNKRIGKIPRSQKSDFLFHVSGDLSVAVRLRRECSEGFKKMDLLDIDVG